MNGKTVTELGIKIDPEQDQVVVDGKLVTSKAPPRVYWMLNKPDLCLTSSKSEDEKKTIFDLPPLRQLTFTLYPVGRLDYRTEGLLLLSNDGELVHRLTHPKFKVPRTYQVLAQRRLTAEEEKALREGIALEDGPTKGTDIRFMQGQSLGQSHGGWYFVKVWEGRNRLVRRMFEHFDVKVLRLIRIAFGDLTLPDDLAPGTYKQLSSDQIQGLKSTVALLD